MEKPKYTVEEGKCPFCGTNDLEWEDTDVDGYIYSHDCSCNKCHHHFKIYYVMTFDGISFDDDEGNFHDFDENGREL